MAQVPTRALEIKLLDDAIIVARRYHDASWERKRFSLTSTPAQDQAVGDLTLKFCVLSTSDRAISLEIRLRSVSRLLLRCRICPGRNKKCELKSIELVDEEVSLKADGWNIVIARSTLEYACRELSLVARGSVVSLESRAIRCRSVSIESDKLYVKNGAVVYCRSLKAITDYFEVAGKLVPFLTESELQITFSTHLHVATKGSIGNEQTKQIQIESCVDGNICNIGSVFATESVMITANEVWSPSRSKDTADRAAKTMRRASLQSEQKPELSTSSTIPNRRRRQSSTTVPSSASYRDLQLLFTEAIVCGSTENAANLLECGANNPSAERLTQKQLDEPVKDRKSLESRNKSAYIKALQVSTRESEGKYKSAYIRCNANTVDNLGQFRANRLVLEVKMAQLEENRAWYSGCIEGSCDELNLNGTFVGIQKFENFRTSVFNVSSKTEMEILEGGSLVASRCFTNQGQVKIYEGDLQLEAGTFDQSSDSKICSVSSDGGATISLTVKHPCSDTFRGSLEAFGIRLTAQAPVVCQAKLSGQTFVQLLVDRQVNAESKLTFQEAEMTVKDGPVIASAVESNVNSELPHVVFQNKLHCLGICMPTARAVFDTDSSTTVNASCSSVWLEFLRTETRDGARLELTGKCVQLRFVEGFVHKGLLSLGGARLDIRGCGFDHQGSIAGVGELAMRLSGDFVVGSELRAERFVALTGQADVRVTSKGSLVADAEWAFVEGRSLSNAGRLVANRSLVLRADLDIDNVHGCLMSQLADVLVAWRSVERYEGSRCELAGQVVTPDRLVCVCERSSELCLRAYSGQDEGELSVPRRGVHLLNCMGSILLKSRLVAPQHDDAHLVNPEDTHMLQLAFAEKASIHASVECPLIVVQLETPIEESSSCWSVELVEEGQVNTQYLVAVSEKADDDHVHLSIESQLRGNPTVACKSAVVSGCGLDISRCHVLLKSDAQELGILSCSGILRAVSSSKVELLNGGIIQSHELKIEGSTLMCKGRQDTKVNIRANAVKIYDKGTVSLSGGVDLQLEADKNVSLLDKASITGVEGVFLDEEAKAAYKNEHNMLRLISPEVQLSASSHLERLGDLQVTASKRFRLERSCKVDYCERCCIGGKITELDGNVQDIECLEVQADCLLLGGPCKSVKNAQLCASHIILNQGDVRSPQLSVVAPLILNVCRFVSEEKGDYLERGILAADEELDIASLLLVGICACLEGPLIQVKTLLHYGYAEVTDNKQHEAGRERENISFDTAEKFLREADQLMGLDGDEVRQFLELAVRHIPDAARMREGFGARLKGHALEALNRVCQHPTETETADCLQACLPVMTAFARASNEDDSQVGCGNLRINSTLNELMALFEKRCQSQKYMYDPATAGYHCLSHLVCLTGPSVVGTESRYTCDCHAWRSDGTIQSEDGLRLRAEGSIVMKQMQPAQIVSTKGDVRISAKSTELRNIYAMESDILVSCRRFIKVRNAFAAHSLTLQCLEVVAASYLMAQDHIYLECNQLAELSDGFGCCRWQSKQIVVAASDVQLSDARVTEACVVRLTGESGSFVGNSLFGADDSKLIVSSNGEHLVNVENIKISFVTLSCSSLKLSEATKCVQLNVKSKGAAELENVFSENVAAEASKVMIKNCSFQSCDAEAAETMDATELYVTGTGARFRSRDMKLEECQFSSLLAASSGNQDISVCQFETVDLLTDGKLKVDNCSVFTKLCAKADCIEVSDTTVKPVEHSKLRTGLIFLDAHGRCGCAAAVKNTTANEIVVRSNADCSLVEAFAHQLVVDGKKSVQITGMQERIAVRGATVDMRQVSAATIDASARESVDIVDCDIYVQDGRLEAYSPVVSIKNSQLQGLHLPNRSAKVSVKECEVQEAIGICGKQCTISDVKCHTLDVICSEATSVTGAGVSGSLRILVADGEVAMSVVSVPSASFKARHVALEDFKSSESIEVLAGEEATMKQCQCPRLIVAGDLIAASGLEMPDSGDCIITGAGKVSLTEATLGRLQVEAADTVELGQFFVHKDMAIDGRRQTYREEVAQSSCPTLVIREGIAQRIDILMWKSGAHISHVEVDDLVRIRLSGAPLSIDNHCALQKLFVSSDGPVEVSNTELGVTKLQCRSLALNGVIFGEDRAVIRTTDKGNDCYDINLNKVVSISNEFCLRGYRVQMQNSEMLHAEIVAEQEVKVAEDCQIDGTMTCSGETIIIEDTKAMDMNLSSAQRIIMKSVQNRKMVSECSEQFKALSCSFDRLQVTELSKACIDDCIVQGDLLVRADGAVQLLRTVVRETAHIVARECVVNGLNNEKAEGWIKELRLLPPDQSGVLEVATVRHISGNQIVVGRSCRKVCIDDVILDVSADTGDLGASSLVILGSSDRSTDVELQNIQCSNVLVEDCKSFKLSRANIAEELALARTAAVTVASSRVLKTFLESCRVARITDKACLEQSFDVKDCDVIELVECVTGKVYVMSELSTVKCTIEMMRCTVENDVVILGIRHALVREGCCFHGSVHARCDSFDCRGPVNFSGDVLNLKCATVKLAGCHTKGVVCIDCSGRTEIQDCQLQQTVKLCSSKNVSINSCSFSSLLSVARCDNFGMNSVMASDIRCYGLKSVEVSNSEVSGECQIGASDQILLSKALVSKDSNLTSKQVAVTSSSTFDSSLQIQSSGGLKLSDTSVSDRLVVIASAGSTLLEGRVFANQCCLWAEGSNPSFAASNGHKPIFNSLELHTGSAVSAPFILDLMVPNRQNMSVRDQVKIYADSDITLDSVQLAMTCSVALRCPNLSLRNATILTGADLTLIASPGRMYLANYSIKSKEGAVFLGAEGGVTDSSDPHTHHLGAPPNAIDHGAGTSKVQEKLRQTFHFAEKPQPREAHEEDPWTPAELPQWDGRQHKSVAQNRDAGSVEAVPITRPSVEEPHFSDDEMPALEAAQTSVEWAVDWEGFGESGVQVSATFQQGFDDMLADMDKEVSDVEGRCKDAKPFVAANVTMREMQQQANDNIGVLQQAASEVGAQLSREWHAAAELSGQLDASSTAAAAAATRRWLQTDDFLEQGAAQLWGSRGRADEEKSRVRATVEDRVLRLTQLATKHGSSLQAEQTGASKDLCSFSVGDLLNPDWRWRDILAAEEDDTTQPHRIGAVLIAPASAEAVSTDAAPTVCYRSRTNKLEVQLRATLTTEAPAAEHLFDFRAPRKFFI